MERKGIEALSLSPSIQSTYSEIYFAKEKNVGLKSN
jgi:hypothetical protein